MKKALFISSEKYSIFLYQFEETFWLEIDKGYNENEGKTPYEFYTNPVNYQILRVELSRKKLNNWEQQLEKICEIY